MIKTNGSAVVSPCGRYRYSLSRWWTRSPTGPWCLWVMLNPSTADASDNDQTISTITEKTWDWAHLLFDPWQGRAEFGGLHVANLYAWRDRDPMKLVTASDPVGPDNDHYIKSLAVRSDLIIAAWGNGPHSLRACDWHQKRINRVCELLLSTGKPIHALELTKSGQPRHPLYTRKDLAPTIWRFAA